MLSPSWKKRLSYFFPITVEKIESQHSGTLSVRLVEGRYQLVTGDAIYSFEDKYTSYGTALEQPHQTAGTSALVLGLGMASIPYLLQKKHHWKGTITCVEWDPVLIRLTQKYYPYPEGINRLKIIEADAKAFMQENARTFDLITVDLFIESEVPYFCWEQSFLEQLKKAVAPGGTLFFSRLTDRHTEESMLWENLEKVFPEKEEIITFGNSIMKWERRDN
ncbi:MAG TPA: hypothetical protein DHW15_10515 [Bacteroidetes bacterium]|jgi:spermidine synthase|nr:MAG: hypothetical protein ABR94_11350 [Sphingobacteriales bacterium BACL12 MAG-120802-bin5]HCK22569.1 hypothetical protein [Bacteroidota bacterium]